MYRGRSFLDHGITSRAARTARSRTAPRCAPSSSWCDADPRSGRAVGPDEAITVEEAIHAYTLGSAYACRKEHVLGSLTPGKLADLVVLGEDPRTSDAIAEIPVLATMVGGTLMPQRSS